MSDLAGRVLAGRYLLHGAIGTGASGRVYVAEDTRLRRRVAVKVLHAALAEDAAFLRRFRAEAQLAASLHHPHIVTVHDWGEDDVPFMVLELLEGGSLRSMLDQGTLAHRPAGRARRPRRRVRARVRARARRAAPRHQAREPAVRRARHRPRRRLRPRARALAEASWTEPAGAVFGTARYASPEQAQGVQLDARSDLYSLALVLVESGDRPRPVRGRHDARHADRAHAAADRRARGARSARAGDRSRRARSIRTIAIPTRGRCARRIADAADSLPPPGPLPARGHGRSRRSASDARGRRARPRRCSTRTRAEVVPLAPPRESCDDPSRSAAPHTGSAGWCPGSWRSC